MMAQVGATAPPLIEGNKTLAQVTADVCTPLERRAGPLWWMAFLVSFSLLVLGIAAVTYQTLTGIGTWGLNRGVGWAFDITNFVFWIGIGHVGTRVAELCRGLFQMRVLAYDPYLSATEMTERGGYLVPRDATRFETGGAEGLVRLDDPASGGK